MLAPLILRFPVVVTSTQTIEVSGSLIDATVRAFELNTLNNQARVTVTRTSIMPNEVDARFRVPLIHDVAVLTVPFSSSREAPIKHINPDAPVTITIENLGPQASAVVVIEVDGLAERSL